MSDPVLGTKWGVWTAALFALALTAGPAVGQTGTVTGSVVEDATGAPVNGVQISIEGIDRGGLTNQQGRYLVVNVPAGTHTVRATYIGFRTTTTEVSVTAGAIATADFRLEVSALSMDEIVVTGTAGAWARAGSYASGARRASSSTSGP